MRAGARDEADAIRAQAERDAARILRDAETRADRLVKERLAYAEAELDRLRSLRRNIGTLLESCVSALRVVEHLMSRDSASASADSPAVGRHFRLLRAFGGTHRFATVLGACMVIAAALGAAAGYWILPRPQATEATSRPAVDSQASSTIDRPADIPLPSNPPSVSPAATTGDSPALAAVSAAVLETPPLTVMLLAERQCWIRATIDGARVMERLLEPDQELMLQAREGVLLRVGDAGALSATVNGKRVTPFGRPGEVITRQITRQNYSRWLAGSS